MHHQGNLIPMHHQAQSGYSSPQYSSVLYFGEKRVLMSLFMAIVFSAVLQAFLLRGRSPLPNACDTEDSYSRLCSTDGTVVLRTSPNMHESCKQKTRRHVSAMDVHHGINKAANAEDLTTYYEERGRQQGKLIGRAAMSILSVKNVANQDLSMKAPGRFSSPHKSPHPAVAIRPPTQDLVKEGRKASNAAAFNRNVKVSSFSTAIYNLAEPTELPDQPHRMVQFLFSLLVVQSNFTNEVSSAIIQCVGSLGTKKPNEKHMGMYRSYQFTPNRIQAEFFADVTEKESLDFPRMLTQYITSGKLTSCVQGSGVRFRAYGEILLGRTVHAPKTAAIISSTGSIPKWVVGGAAGCAAFVGLAVLIGVAAIGERETEHLEEPFAHQTGLLEGVNVDSDGTTAPYDNHILIEIERLAGAPNLNTWK